ncbi:MAG TPA: DUF3343 domain-containing protein [Firmicutes bacterium]|nr:DUF3343 domain-containing protein [Bacillota bacterium]
MTMLAVFRSRAQALDALSLLKGAGVPSQAVSTPKEAGIGCGVSVKFDCNFFPRVRPLLAGRRYSAFWGYLRICGGAFVRV